MKESQKNRYFVDGFFIKHFGVWPPGVDKNDLFNEQKEFLIYLMGALPEIEDWKTQMSYENELNEIKGLKSVELTAADIDVAKLQGRSVEKLRKDRLNDEKVKRYNQLREKYGLEPIQKEREPDGIPERKPEDRGKPPERLWDMLEGKGIVKEKTDGL